MTIDEALAINGFHVHLALEYADEPFRSFVSGRVVGVVVPCAASPVLPHLLLDSGGSVSPCGGGLEVFLSDVSRVLRTA